MPGAAPADKKLQADAKEFVPSFLQPAAAPSKPAWGAPSDLVKKAAPMKAAPSSRQPASKQQPARQTNKRHGKERHSSQKDRSSHSRNNNPEWRHGNKPASDNWSRGKVLPIELLAPASGPILRHSSAALLSLRLLHLSPPPSWTEHECSWGDEDRVSLITLAAHQERTGGDVVFPKKKAAAASDTAPPIEECKALEINEETRWKARVFDSSSADQSADREEEVVRRALLILNKLSLTKFDKLSDEFIDCIGQDVDVLSSAVGLIVQKAQEEQHFSAMYAGLCLKLANTEFVFDPPQKKGKVFKKKLLERCQHEFETDTTSKIADATRDCENEEEKEYIANLIKKHYLGHMRFIGELYKGDLISIKIMLACLPQLLARDDENASSFDEEKVECFAKLMTVIGSSLEMQSEAMRNVGKVDASESLGECWKTVEALAGKTTGGTGGGDGPKVSNRIKFMLQDLLEMKQNGWVTRRQEESAKTLSQIHKEVAREERARRSSSTNQLRNMAKGNIRRGVSSGDVRALDKKPQVDSDGFVSVVNPKSVHRSASMTAIDGGFQKYTARGSTVLKDKPKLANLAETKSYPSPDKCGEKAKTILKEYFVGGDTDDAVLSIHELVGAGNDGSIERGAKIIESSILTILEMKNEEVDKFLVVFLRCANESKLNSESFVRGLNDPLEFLSDIAVDAPLATLHLVRVVGELVKARIIPFDFLLSSPEYFRSDQNAARFGVHVLKAMGGGDLMKDAGYVGVIEKLMTEEERSLHSVEEFIQGNA